MKTNYFLLAGLVFISNVFMANAQITYETEKVVVADSSFSNEGLTDPEIIPSAEIMPGSGITLYATANYLFGDGKSLLAFHTNFYGDGLVKYTNNGSLDATFGTGGIIRTAPFDQLSITVITELSNGKLLVCGNNYSSMSDAYVYRLNSDGSIDATFGTGGFYKYSSTSNTEFLPSAIAVRADGSIIIGGGFHYKSSYKLPAFFALSAAGELTTSFGTSGTLLLSPECYSIEHLKILIQSDNKIMVGFNSFNYWSYDSEVDLTRFTSSGQIDNTYNGGNLISLNSKTGYNYDLFINMYQISDGSLLVAAKDSLTYLANYSSTGAINTSFGTNGKVRYNSIDKLFPSTVANHYLMTYYSSTVPYTYQIARISESGDLDATYGNSGSAKILYGTLMSNLDDLTFYNFEIYEDSDNQLEIQRSTIKDVIHAYVTIPDNNFRAILKNAYPESFNINDKLDINTSEIRLAETISVIGANISDLTGIQYFPKLKALYCYENNLTTIPTLSNTVEEIDCHYNYSLSNLDITPYVNLNSLTISDTYITSVNLSNAPNLQYLYCDNLGITNLDLNTNIELLELSCTSCSLSNLDLSANTKLKKLYCLSNQLSTLELSNNVLLERIDCSGNNLSSLSIGNCTSLVYFDCSYNNLTSLTIPDPIGNVYASNNCFTSTPIAPVGHTGTFSVTPNKANCVTGIMNKNDKSISIDFYPNPATKGITIKAPVQSTIQWYNNLGVLQKTHSMNHEDEYVDLSELKEGIYMLKCGEKSMLLVIEE